MSLGFGSVVGTVLPAGSTSTQEPAPIIGAADAWAQEPLCGGNYTNSPGSRNSRRGGQEAAFEGWRICGSMRRATSRAWFLMLAVFVLAFFCDLRVCGDTPVHTGPYACGFAHLWFLVSKSRALCHRSLPAPARQRLWCSTSNCIAQSLIACQSSACSQGDPLRVRACRRGARLLCVWVWPRVPVCLAE